MPIIWLFIIPFIGAGCTAYLRNKVLAVIFSLIPLLLLLAGTASNFEMSHYAWFPPLSIDFSLKIDNLSLVFLFLTAIVIPISIIISKPSLYALILFLEGLLIGFFTAGDLVFFTIFWEAMLLPLYFLINLGNKPEKYSASLKFLIYMFAGSVLMVISLIAIYLENHTFNIASLAGVAENAPFSVIVFALFALAFAVKTPLFPFHAWLPKTYDQAPTSGTILLSALLSKAGIYGFIRIGAGLFPKTMALYSFPLTVLAIFGALYGAVAAYKQTNFKKIIAYSSFSHVNFILAGIFIGTETALNGAILQSFNHGIIITGLFLVSGWLEMRLNSNSIYSAGGMAKPFPKLCWLTFIFVLASIALPGTNGFIGELLILVGIFTSSKWLAAFLTLSIILGAAYMLRYMQVLYFNDLHRPPLNQHDIDFKNILIALPLVLIIFWIGIYPSTLLNLIVKDSL